MTPASDASPLLRRWYLALYLVGLVGYGAVACERLTGPSVAPHFVYQADAWLHGTIAIEPDCGPCGPDDSCPQPPPPCDRQHSPLPDNDWAVVESVELTTGAVVKGRRLTQQRAFRTLAGELVPLEKVKRTVGYTSYVSFPALPSLLMIPSALIGGRGGNDVIPTILLAAAILPLTLLLLRRLAAAGLSRRTLTDDLWLVAMLGFGSVMFFSAVQGKVWYTAHVVGVVLALIYGWASIEARSPLIAGLALGAAALTRTSMAFMFPLFLFELWRVVGAGLPLRERWRSWVVPLARFAIPIAAFAIVGMVYNYLRFESLTEFGHSYLTVGNRQPVRQQVQIEQWGLASFHYLSRNLSVAFALLPDVIPRAPFVQISGHGLAMWVTTPALLLVVWPRERGPLHRALWVTVAAVALPSLMYMNTGWFQFGYRFSLDYMVFLVMLIAVGGRPLGRVAKTLIAIGIAINLFGAYTFDRVYSVYRVGGNAYDVVSAIGSSAAAG